MISSVYTDTKPVSTSPTLVAQLGAEVFVS
jgi:hypothetical protein